jgi:hypothetical protein
MEHESSDTASAALLKDSGRIWLIVDNVETLGETLMNFEIRCYKA